MKCKSKFCRISFYSFFFANSSLEIFQVPCILIYFQIEYFSNKLNVFDQFLLKNKFMPLWNAFRIYLSVFSELCEPA